MSIYVESWYPYKPLSCIFPNSVSRRWMILPNKFLRLRQPSQDAGTSRKRCKIWRIGFPFTRTWHISSRLISKTVAVENGSPTGTFGNDTLWKLENDENRAVFDDFGTRRIFLPQASTVFELFRHRVNASSNFGTFTFFIIFEMCRHRVNAV